MAVAMKQLGKQMSEVKLLILTWYFFVYWYIIDTTVIFQLHSWQEMLCAQLDQALVQQLDLFLNNDISTLLTLKESHAVSRIGIIYDIKMHLFTVVFFQSMI